MATKRKGAGGHDGGGGGHDAAGGLRWLLTYADMITLLLALFIFLYSISEISASKLVAFSESFSQLFGIGRIPQSATSQSGGSGILPEANSIVRMMHALEEDLQELVDSGMVDLEEHEEGMTLRLKDKVLYDLGSAELSKSAEPILDDVAKYLRELPNAVRVEGHTDNLPMARGGAYKSNWELSAARAASVVRYLIERCHVDPDRLSLAGYGEYKPIAHNKPFRGNPVNRRVEIVVLKRIKLAQRPDTTAPAEELRSSSAPPAEPPVAGSVIELDDLP